MESARTWAHQHGMRRSRAGRGRLPRCVGPALPQCVERRRGVPRPAVPVRRDLTLFPAVRNGLTNVTLDRVALSDQAGTASMAVHVDAHGCDTIGEAEPGASSTKVDTMASDDFLAASPHGEPHVVKVGIEGHEPEFLAGAWGMFARRRPLLIMEVNPSAWHAAGRVRTWQETLDRLFELYGKGTWFDAGQTSIVDRVDASGLDDQRVYTLLFAGADR